MKGSMTKNLPPFAPVLHLPSFFAVWIARSLRKFIDAFVDDLETHAMSATHVVPPYFLPFDPGPALR